MPHTMPEENLSLALRRARVRTRFGLPQLKVCFYIYPCSFFQSWKKFDTEFVKTKDLVVCNHRRRTFCMSENKKINENMDNFVLFTSVGVRWKNIFGRNSITCKCCMSLSMLQSGLINEYLTNSLSCLVSLFSGSLAKYPISESLQRSFARVFVDEKAC